MVHLLVGGQHSDEVPDRDRRLVVPVQQAEKRLEMVLIGAEGVARHLMFLESNLLHDFAHPLQVKSHVVVLNVRVNGFEACADGSIVIEPEELIQVDATVLVPVVLRHDVLDAVVVFETSLLRGS